MTAVSEPHWAQATAVSQVSRVLAPGMPTGLSAAAPVSFSHPYCYCLFAAGTLHLCRFAHQFYRVGRALGKVIFPVDLRVALSPVSQFSRSVTQSCPTLCDPMNRSTPGLPVHHQLPEFTQTHVHRVSDAIQPSHPLSSPSPPTPNPSQHQSLFQ